jgi:hypothetical protein
VRTAQYIDDWPQVAGCERVNQVGPFACRDLEEAQRPEIEGGLDIRADGVKTCGLHNVPFESKTDVPLDQATHI